MTPFNRNMGQGRAREGITPDRNWKELTKAGNMYEPGNANTYETGDWRTIAPIIDMEKCINCLFCWRYCPDASIFVKDGKFEEFDYKHCKGCGICANVCPTNAIEMIPEDELDKEKEASKNE